MGSRCCEFYSLITVSIFSIHFRISTDGNIRSLSYNHATSRLAKREFMNSNLEI